MRPGQLYKALAVICAILAAVTGAAFVRMSWSRAPDFDVTGFLLLASNAGRITMLLLLLFFLGAALGCWYRAWQEGE